MSDPALILHETIGKLAQEVSDKHGIQIRSVSIAWHDMRSVADDSYIVQSVQLETFHTAGKRHG